MPRKQRKGSLGLEIEVGGKMAVAKAEGCRGLVVRRG